MKIIIDSAIPFINGVFEPYADVVYVAGHQIDNSIIKDADALIIRTRTRCDSAMLDGSSVRHIATATIGYDHIDLDYCHKHGIKVSTAAGCNARGVLQWVGAALALLSKRGGWQPSQRRLGVVGVGNVGSLIERYGRLWGFDVVCCDPPRGVEHFVEFEKLLSEVDIVSFHTPLDKSTYHMLNSQNIGLLRPNSIIMNSSRGEVIESQALLDNPSHSLILDVWENEPHIDTTLLNRATIATMHIAGYSTQGKANGTAIVVDSIARDFDLPLMGWYPDVARNCGCDIEWDSMCESITQHFDIEHDSQTLKANRSEFERLRNGYSYREEYF